MLKCSHKTFHFVELSRVDRQEAPAAQQFFLQPAISFLKTVISGLSHLSWRFEPVKAVCDSLTGHNMLDRHSPQIFWNLCKTTFQWMYLLLVQLWIGHTEFTEFFQKISGSKVNILEQSMIQLTAATAFVFPSSSSSSSLESVKSSSSSPDIMNIPFAFFTFGPEDASEPAWKYQK